MKKTTTLCVWYVLLASMIAIMFTGCGVSTFKATPTALPLYLHYTPSDGFDVRLGFDYPSLWVLSEEKFQYTDYIFVGLGDPRLLTVPTRAPNESHGTPSDFGRIGILIRPIAPDQTLAILVEPHKQGYNNASWITSLNNYKTTIDEYDALVFEYLVEPIFDNGYTSVMFERDIFFVVEDQFYQVDFLVAEKERGGKFEQGYEYFINSLKIVP